MVSPVDPNEIRLTGENSFIRLSLEADGPLTARASHWRVLLSPAGPGHALFMESEAIDNQVLIYADNVAMARWLQGEIEQSLYAPFGDQTLMVIEASFSRHGDQRSFSTEKVVSRDTEISLTWYDLGEPFLIRFEPGSIRPGIPHGVYSVLTPARQAQLTVNGRAARGRAFPQDTHGQLGSTCSLAWSETWLRPR